MLGTSKNQAAKQEHGPVIPEQHRDAILEHPSENHGNSKGQGDSPVAKMLATYVGGLEFTPKPT